MGCMLKDASGGGGGGHKAKEGDSEGLKTKRGVQFFLSLRSCERTSVIFTQRWCRKSIGGDEGKKDPTSSLNDSLEGVRWK